MNTNEFDNVENYGDNCDNCDNCNVCEIQPEKEKFDIKTAKNAFGSISFALFIAVALIFTASFVLKKLIPHELFANAWIAYTLNFVIMYVISFPLAYLFIKGLPKDNSDLQTENKMNTRTFVRLFVSAAFLMYAGNIIGTVFTGFFTFFKYFLREMPSQSFSDMFNRDASIATILYVAVIAPIFEEIVFRKVIIDRIKRFGYMPAMIFSGVAFGFFHGNFSQFFYATLLGMLLGYIYCRTGKIIHTILMHSVINIYGGVVPTLIFSFVDTERLDAIQAIADYDKYIEAISEFALDHILPIIFYALHAVTFFVLAVIGLIFLIKDRKRYKAGVLKADPPMPGEKTFSLVFLSAGFILFVCTTLVEFYYSL
ncbi:MAG: CPBP family intramembrane metalloprotease [Ruminococcaceae bacterium]|nr:CPBP family intramembrane metalloprotease [Oscillospiraceae bacterium]